MPATQIKGGQPAKATCPQLLRTKRCRRAKLRAGFTLTELLIVITLIAILTIAGLAMYQLQIAKSYDAIRKRDLNNLKIAFEHYYSDHACYPDDNILDNCGGADLAPYLPKIPCDPETGLPYTLNLDLPAGCAQEFAIYAELTNESDPQILCNGQYVVFSPNANQNEIELACEGETFCTGGYYGCVQGSCVLVNAVEKPSCSPWFCSTNCQSACGFPTNEFPQPCP